MKKRFLATILCTGLAVSMLAGCGSKKETETKKTEAKLETLADYKGLKVGKSVATVSDGTVQTILNGYASAHSTDKKVTTGKVKKGDKANIDYTGKINGKTFDGGSATGYDLTIGSNSFISGFEDGLIGKKIGDTVTLHLTFPKDYKDTSTGKTSEYAGKKVDFEVKINYVTQTTIPKVNDAFVKKYYSYAASDVAGLKKYIKEQTRQSNIINNVWEGYVAKCKVTSYDSDRLETLKKNYEDYYEYMYYSQYGADLDTYLKAIDKTKSEWEEDIVKEVKQSLKQEMIVREIAKKENIDVSKLYKKEAEALASQQTYSNVSEMESQMGKDTIELTIMRNAVYKLIADEAKVVKDSETTQAETTTTQDETTQAETTKKN